MWWNILTFTIAYVVYHLTAFPSVPGGDSGELLAEACILGVAHPPGYPLFTLLSYFVMKFFHVPRIFFLESGQLTIEYQTTRAWQVNHMCLIFGALAASMISASVYRLISYRYSQVNVKSLYFAPLASSFAGLLYAFSPLIWEYSITAEVFSLNNFLCATIVYLTLVILTSSKTAKVSYVILGAFLCGLVLTNQHTSLLLIIVLIPMIMYSLYSSASEVFLITLIQSGVSFLLGFSPYLYLYWSSTRAPEGSWGATDSIIGLIRHILRSEFGTFQLGFKVGKENAIERMWIYFTHTSEESGHILFPILFIGIMIFLFSLRATHAIHATHAILSKETLVKEVSPIKKTNKRDKKVISTPIRSEPSPQPSQLSLPDAIPPSDHFPLFVIALAWLFYTIIWHGIFSNLPLNAPMPFAVHSRFWMQPNILLYILFGYMMNEMLLLVINYVQYLPSMLFNLCCLSTIFTILLNQRFSMNDRSQKGWIMHKYGEMVLHSLQSSQQSLLFSHTDLDWNPTRYLRLCEGVYPEIAHHSIQMIPYPWFQTKYQQRLTLAKQQQQHPSNLSYALQSFHLPKLDFPGLSTDRASEGNARLISELLIANDALISPSTSSTTSPNKRFSQGIYLDMQSINEAEIEPMGKWRQHFLLVPYGNQYRVYPSSLTLSDIENLHMLSYQKILEIQTIFPELNDEYNTLFLKGSWEQAAFNVYYDAHYQLGLFYLTYAIEKQTQNTTMQAIPMLFDRLIVASSLLTKTLDAVQRYQSFSSSIVDLSKNTALSYLRLQALIQIMFQYKEALIPLLQNLIKTQDDSQVFMNSQAIKDFLLRPEEYTHQILRKSEQRISDFMVNYPKDAHINVFMTARSSILKALHKNN